MVTAWLSLLVLFMSILVASSICANGGANTHAKDEFNDATLNPVWRWMNPSENCNYSLTVNLGNLRISVPAGNYDLDIPGRDQSAPRVLQPISGDFVVETKLNLDFKSINQFAGILIWSNNSHFVRFQIGCLDVYPQQVVEAEAAQVTETIGGWVEIGKNASSRDITLLRVQREEHRFTFSYSIDGQTWTRLASQTLGQYSEDLLTGLFVASRQGKDAIHADFDYFEVFQGQPSEPRNLIAEAGDRQITLSWSPPLSDGGAPITNYNIYRSNETGKQEFLITVGSVTTYMDEDLINERRYYYKVSAVNEKTVEGKLSIEVSAVPTFVQLEQAPGLGWGLMLGVVIFFSMLVVSKRLLGWKLSNIYTTLRRRKRDVILIFGWALAIGLVIIFKYWFFYFKYPMYYDPTKYDPFFQYGGPSLEPLDMLLLVIVSVIAGMCLSDLESTIIGALAAMILSFLVAFVYSLLFIWTALRFGPILARYTYGWEYAVLWAGVNIGRIMFPLAIVLCLLGGITGAILRGWIKP